MGGVSYGSKASALNMEAKPLSADVKVRSCVLTRYDYFYESGSMNLIT